MRNTARIAVLAAVFLVVGCPPVRPPAAGLERAVEAYFDEMLALNPTYATDIDDHRFDDRLEITPSPAYESQSLALERRYLDDVRAIDPGTLNDEERLTRELFIYNREREIESLGFPGRLLPIDQFDGGLAIELPSYGDGTGSQPFETVADYDRWLARARQFPRWVDAAIAVMREGMARGVVHPRIVMAKVVPQLEDLLAADPERSVYYGPIDRMPAEFPAADRSRLTKSFVGLIERDLNPSYRKLRDFIRDEYIPACRTTVGWSELPNGAAWYANEVRRHTTTRMTPDEIHELGLAEVTRIRAGMEEVMREVRFKGTLAEFFHATTRPVHRALPDALATADVLTGLLDRLAASGVRTLAEAGLGYAEPSPAATAELTPRAS